MDTLIGSCVDILKQTQAQPSALISSGRQAPCHAGLAGLTCCKIQLSVDHETKQADYVMRLQRNIDLEV